MYAYPCNSLIITPVGQSVSPAYAKCFPMKQLENDLQCKTESGVIGRMDLFGGTGLLNPKLANGRFEGLHFHDLRASWCVDLLSHGANLNEVQMIGGWSTLSAIQAMDELSITVTCCKTTRRGGRAG